MISDVSLAELTKVGDQIAFGATIVRNAHNFVPVILCGVLPQFLQPSLEVERFSIKYN